MSKRLIIFAQRVEAYATLHTLKASPVQEESVYESDGNAPSCFACEHGWIVLSGIGIYAAQMTVAKYGPKASEIWNLGFAGALQDELNLGQVLRIKIVGKYIPSGKLDSLSRHCVTHIVPNIYLDTIHSPLIENSTQLFPSLISSDFPIHDLTHRMQLAKKWHLVDMEAYGVAYAAYKLGKKCQIWKITSDFASPGGRELIRKNKAKFSEVLAETVYEAIHESCSHP